MSIVGDREDYAYFMEPFIQHFWYSIAHPDENFDGLGVYILYVDYRIVQYITIELEHIYSYLKEFDDLREIELGIIISLLNDLKTIISNSRAIYTFRPIPTKVDTYFNALEDLAAQIADFIENYDETINNRENVIDLLETVRQQFAEIREIAVKSWFNIKDGDFSNDLESHFLGKIADILTNIGINNVEVLAAHLSMLFLPHNPELCYAWLSAEVEEDDFIPVGSLTNESVVYSDTFKYEIVTIYDSLIPTIVKLDIYDEFDEIKVKDYDGNDVLIVNSSGLQVVDNGILKKYSFPPNLKTDLIYSTSDDCKTLLVPNGAYEVWFEGGPEGEKDSDPFVIVSTFDNSGEESGKTGSYYGTPPDDGRVTLKLRLPVKVREHNIDRLAYSNLRVNVFDPEIEGLVNNTKIDVYEGYIFDDIDTRVLVASTYSNDTDEYRNIKLWPGSYFLKVSHPNDEYFPFEKAFSIDSNYSDKNYPQSVPLFKNGPPGSIEGRVINQKYIVWTGTATVNLYRGWNNRLDENKIASLSTSNGSFSFDNIERGYYTLEAIHLGDSVYGPIACFGETQKNLVIIDYSWGDDIANTLAQAEAAFGEAQKLASPLLVNLDGNRIETIALRNGVYFDHHANGFKVKTGWAAPLSGFLVCLDANGKVTSGRNLFGDNTLLKNGQLAANGFEALKDLDSNGDGVFDQKDPTYRELYIWFDFNSNGEVDPSELIPLMDAGIVSIDLNYEEIEVVDPNGNWFKQISTAVMDDGSVIDIIDVWFARDLTDSTAVDVVPVSDDVSKLPNIRGFGITYSLHQAMMRDSSRQLQRLVEQFGNETNETTRKNLVPQIIFKWTGMDDKILALENLLGEKFIGNWEARGNSIDKWGPQATRLIHKAFDRVADAVYENLMVQTHYAFLYQLLKVNNENEKIDMSLIAEGILLDSKMFL